MYSKFYTTDSSTPKEAFAKFAKHHGVPSSNSSNPDWYDDFDFDMLIYVDSDGKFDGFDNYPEVIAEPWHYSQHPDIPIVPLTHIIRPPSTRRRHATHT